MGGPRTGGAGPVAPCRGSLAGPRRQAHAVLSACVLSTAWMPSPGGTWLEGTGRLVQGGEPTSLCPEAGCGHPRPGKAGGKPRWGVEHITVERCCDDRRMPKKPRPPPAPASVLAGSGDAPGSCVGGEWGCSGCSCSGAPESPACPPSWDRDYCPFYACRGGAAGRPQDTHSAGQDMNSSSRQ